MSEGILSAAQEGTPGQESTSQMNGGTLLRTAREAQGLHIGALAVLLKVPVKKLEALEADRFDLLPDIVFVRALAASVCRTLCIDPAPILQRLPSTAGPRLKTDEAGINTPFRAAGQGGSGMAFWDQLSKPVALAVLALLVGVVVLVFFPFKPLTDSSSELSSGTSTMTLPASVPTSALMTSENPVAAEGAAASTLLAGLALSSSDAPLALNPADAASAPALPTAATVAPTGVVPGSGKLTGPLVLTAQSPSWIEVIDARGVVQVRKSMASAEVLGVSGSLPLSVVIGRADAVAVQVQGKSFDLKPIAKNNVARFEVK